MISKMKIERIRRGWSQQALAEIAQVATGDVSRIETGRMVPYPEQRRRLSKVLGLSEVDLQENVEIEVGAVSLEVTK